MRIRSIAAILTILVVAAPPANAGKRGSNLDAPCLGHEGSPVESAGRGWTKIAPPAFAQALLPQWNSDFISDFAVDPTNPKRMFLTNNQAVMRSEDGGCTWKDVLDVPHDGANANRVSIEVPMSGSGTVHVLSVNNSGLYGDGVTLQTSHDGGSTWSTSADLKTESIGMNTCSLDAFKIAPSEPKKLYLCLTPASLALSSRPWLFYKSTDAGETWSLQSDLTTTALAFGPRFNAIETAAISYEVDPLEPDTLIAQGSYSGLGLGYLLTDALITFVAISTDGGISWSNSRFDEETAQHGPLALQHPAGSGRTIFWGAAQEIKVPTCGGDTGQGCVLVSPDDGASWSPMYLPMPQHVQELRAGEKEDQLLVANTEGKIFRFEPRTSSWVDVTPREDLGGVMDILSDRSSKQGFYFLRSDSIFVYRGKV